MNRYALSLAALALTLCMQAPARTSTPAGDPLSEQRLAKAEQNYLACLNSDNAGLVESAIAMTARLAVTAPDHRLTDIAEKLQDLALHGATASIRFKAYLVCVMLDNRSLNVSAGDIAGLDNPGLFTLIATRLQASLLGLSGE